MSNKTVDLSNLWSEFMKTDRSQFELRLLLGTEFHDQALSALKTISSQDDIDRWVEIATAQYEEDEETPFLQELKQIAIRLLPNHEQLYKEAFDQNRRYGGYTKEPHVSLCYLSKGIKVNPEFSREALRLIRAIGVWQDYANMFDYAGSFNDGFFKDFGFVCDLLNIAKSGSGNGWWKPANAE